MRLGFELSCNHFWHAVCPQATGGAHPLGLCGAPQVKWMTDTSVRMDGGEVKAI